MGLWLLRNVPPLKVFALKLMTGVRRSQTGSLVRGELLDKRIHPGKGEGIWAGIGTQVRRSLEQQIPNIKQPWCWILGLPKNDGRNSPLEIPLIRINYCSWLAVGLGQVHSICLTASRASGLAL